MSRAGGSAAPGIRLHASRRPACVGMPACRRVCLPCSCLAYLPLPPPPALLHSVVVLADTDTCGPLWRAHSLALSESSATPRGERALGVLAAAGLHSSSPSVGSTGELVLGQAPLGFSLSPPPPEGCLPCYPQSPELAGASSAAAEAAAAAAGPKGGGHRRQSWDAAGAKGKIKAAHSRQRSWDVAAARAEPQERQAGCRIMPPPPPPLGRSAPSTSAGPAAPGAFA